MKFRIVATILVLLVLVALYALTSDSQENAPEQVPPGLSS
jgi:lipopolysaccharide export system protein LptC